MKRKNLARALLIAMATGSAALAGPESDSYEEKMRSALQLHVDAGTFGAEQQAIDAYLEVAAEHATEWLPYYWASYLNTQLANIYGRVPDTPDNIDRMEFVNRAQETLDRASERIPDKSPTIASDFHALQHFIFMFRSRGSQDEGEKLRYSESSEAELKAAIRSDPHNPLVYVLAATNLLRGSETGVREALAARVLLETAQELFEAEGPDRALTTHWNQEWIGLFWLQHSSDTLSKLAAETKP